LLPNQGIKLQDVEKKLTPTLFAEIFEQFEQQEKTQRRGPLEVILRMPKFVVSEQAIDLLAALSNSESQFIHLSGHVCVGAQSIACLLNSSFLRDLS
jgi:hypothetical protein